MLGWALDAGDMGVLNTMPVQQRMVHGALWLSKDGPYKTMRDLWDEEEPGTTAG